MNNFSNGQLKPKVLVMMATYNGETYISEQIDSILNQESVDVDITICDDGSTDNTCKICKAYAAKYPSITFQKNKINKRVARNFMDMVYEANIDKYDFFAFSDQDDYWLPNKISIAIEKLDSLPEGPRLYYSDVNNFNEDLSGEGRKDYYIYENYVNKMKPMLVANWASGCTMVFNKELCKILQKCILQDFPRGYHDMWVHVVGVACGYCYGDLQNSYLKRRIHSGNVCGETQSFFSSVDAKKLWQMFLTIFHEHPHEATREAKIILDAYGDIIHPKEKKILEDFVQLPSSMKMRFKMAFDNEYCIPSKIESFLLKIRFLLNYL